MPDKEEYIQELRTISTAFEVQKDKTRWLFKRAQQEKWRPGEDNEMDVDDIDSFDINLDTLGRDNSEYVGDA